MTEWRRTILGLVKKRGYESITAFADAFPNQTLVELADNLGSCRGIQLERTLHEEAIENRQLARFARSYLARVIRWMLPEGWDRGEFAKSDTKMAHAHWSVGVGKDFEADADAAFRRLRELKPAPGWLPEGPDDPLLVEAFRGLAFGDPQT
jgi:hypothetical protein